MSRDQRLPTAALHNKNNCRSRWWGFNLSEDEVEINGNDAFNCAEIANETRFPLVIVSDLNIIAAASLLGLCRRLCPPFTCRPLFYGRELRRSRTAIETWRQSTTTAPRKGWDGAFELLSEPHLRTKKGRGREGGPEIQRVEAARDKLQFNLGLPLQQYWE